jgi:hypothetical protein
MGATSELRLFFRSIWPPDDLVIDNHFDALTSKLERAVRHDWLGPIISPRLDYLQSLPTGERENCARTLGIHPGGQIDSGLALGSRGYFVDSVWIAAVNAEQVFISDPLAEQRPRFRPSQSNPSSPKFTLFPQILKETLREAVNAVRVDLGLPCIGEGWLSEADLFRRIKELLPDEEVIHHGKPKWLGRQHLDIWIPHRRIAVEYHGEQHFSPVAFFGGEAALEKTRERDTRKRRIAQENGITLIEITFNDILTNEWIRGRLGI